MPSKKAYQFFKHEDIDNELIINSHDISQLPPDRIQLTRATQNNIIFTLAYI